MNSSKVYFGFSKGLEEYCRQEILEKSELLELDIEELQNQKGGCYYHIAMADLQVLLPFIKLANTCNLVLEEFKCRDLPKLYQKIKKVTWNKYLLNGEYSLKVKANKSRLNNEKRISETATNALNDYFVSQAPKKRNEAYKHEIVIQVQEDLCRLQINLAGIHLHKRSAKINNIAPLRETYAAAMFYIAKREANKNFQRIIDPMCGSGSLLLESANFNKASKRNYAINFLASTIYKGKPKTQFLATGDEFQLFANDIDNDCIRQCKNNLSQTTNKASYTSLNILDKKFYEEFKEISFDLTLLNPPYGQRIPWDKKNYKKLAESLNTLNTDLVCIVLPVELINSMSNILCYTKVKSIRFRNGGLPVEISCFLKK